MSVERRHVWLGEGLGLHPRNECLASARRWVAGALDVSADGDGDVGTELTHPRWLYLLGNRYDGGGWIR